MARNGFWSGFGLGAVTGVAAGVAAFTIASGRASTYNSRILRLERSIQIARAPEDVFAAWSDLRSLAGRLSAVRRIDVSGQHSNWVLEIDGQPFEFAAETAQVIPGQAIGWKSISGPKHSGRINFARLGDDTLVHVSMNYAPPLGRFGRLLAPITDHLESQIDQALRDFKRAMEEEESAGQSGTSATAGWNGESPLATGTGDKWR
jgi:uncharacterized membrane protein